MPYTPQKNSTYDIIYSFLIQNETITRDDIRFLILDNRKSIDPNTIKGIINYLKHRKLIERKNNEYKSALYHKKPYYIAIDIHSHTILLKRADFIEILKESKRIPSSISFEIFEITSKGKTLLAKR